MDYPRTSPARLDVSAEQPFENNPDIACKLSLVSMLRTPFLFGSARVPCACGVFGGTPYTARRRGALPIPTAWLRLKTDGRWKGSVTGDGRGVEKHIPVASTGSAFEDRGRDGGYDLAPPSIVGRCSAAQEPWPAQPISRPLLITPVHFSRPFQPLIPPNRRIFFTHYHAEN